MTSANPPIKNASGFVVASNASSIRSPKPYLPPFKSTSPNRAGPPLGLLTSFSVAFSVSRSSSAFASSSDALDGEGSVVSFSPSLARRRVARSLRRRRPKAPASLRLATTSDDRDERRRARAPPSFAATRVVAAADVVARIIASSRVANACPRARRSDVSATTDLAGLKEFDADTSVASSPAASQNDSGGGTRASRPGASRRVARVVMTELAPARDARVGDDDAVASGITSAWEDALGSIRKFASDVKDLSASDVKEAVSKIGETTKGDWNAFKDIAKDLGTEVRDALRPGVASEAHAALRSSASAPGQRRDPGRPPRHRSSGAPVAVDDTPRGQAGRTLDTIFAALNPARGDADDGSGGGNNAVVTGGMRDGNSLRRGGGGGGGATTTTTTTTEITEADPDEVVINVQSDATVAAAFRKINALSASGGADGWEPFPLPSAVRELMLACGFSGWHQHAVAAMFGALLLLVAWTYAMRM